MISYSINFIFTISEFLLVLSRDIYVWHLYVGVVGWLKQSTSEVIDVITYIPSPFSLN